MSGLHPSVQLWKMPLKNLPPFSGSRTKPAARASAASSGEAERFWPCFGTSWFDQAAQRSLTFQTTISFDVICALSSSMTTLATTRAAASAISASEVVHLMISSGSMRTMMRPLP